MCLVIQKFAPPLKHNTQRVNMNKIRVLLADSIQKKFDIDVGHIRSGKGLYCLASSKDMSQVQQQIFLKQHILLSTFRIDIAALQIVLKSDDRRIYRSLFVIMSMVLFPILHMIRAFIVMILVILSII